VRKQNNFHLKKIIKPEVVFPVFLFVEMIDEVKKLKHSEKIILYQKNQKYT